MKYVKYNGKTNQDLGLRVVGWTRQILPSSRDSLEYIEGVDGPIHIDKPLGSRIVSITFEAKFSNDEERADVQSRVAQWLFTRQFTKLELSDEPGLYYMAKVLDDSDLDPEYFQAEFEIVFTCQPFKFGAEHDEDLFTDSLGGIFTNPGTYDSRALFTIRPTTDANSFELKVNDAVISYDGSVVAGDTITVDSRSLEFRLNGDLMIMEVSGYFPVIKPGDNELIVNVQSDIHANWQELYL